MTTTPARYTAWAANRRRQIAYGRWQPYEPIGPSRQLVEDLRASGLSLAAISVASGVAHTAIRRLANPGYGSGGDKVTVATANRLRALASRTGARMNPRHLPPDTLVDATGTVRRIHALQALGWTLGDLAARLGFTSIQGVNRLTIHDKVTARNAVRVADVYDDLSMTSGPSDITRRRAARKGWAPPLAWDDDTIDDPTARPAGVDDLKARRDRDQLVDEAEDLADMGEHLTTAAARLGVRPDTLERTLYRAGRHDLVARLKGRTPTQEATA